MKMIHKYYERKAIIIQGISDKHMDIIKDSKTAKEMLSALQAIFVRTSAFGKLSLWRKLMNLKCNNKENLEDHFLKFDTITRELEELGSKIDESDKVCHLLLTLGKEYETVITALETQPDVKFDFVKARLLDEEIKLKTKLPTKSENEVSFKASSSRTRNDSGCFNCGDKNHYIAQCPKKTTFQGRRGNQSSFRGRGNFNNRRGKVFSNYAQKDEISFVACKDRDKVLYIEEFIIDSGASNNMLKEELRDNMFDIVTIDKSVTIYIANGEIMKATEKGKLRILCQNKTIIIEALIVPGLKHNLLALSKMVSKNYQVTFNKTGMTINGFGCKIFCDYVRGLYVLKASIMKTTEEKCFAVQSTSVKNMWHRRLGHLNNESLRQLGLPFKNEPCEVCIEGKATRLPFNEQKKSTRKIGELIHSDICGPVNPMTQDGEKYFQVIIDDYSNFVVVRLLKRKIEAENNLIEYITELERQQGIFVKRIRIDNGGEFTSTTFKRYARSNGIKLEYTMSYSPQSNGKSERMNRTLTNMIRTKLIDSCVPKFLWGEAVRCSAYELNRSPSSTLRKGETPSLLWNGRQDISKLKIFGCRAWYTVLPKSNKLDSRAKPAVMIGYCGGGYRLWLPTEYKVIRSRDVRFDETKFEFKEQQILNPIRETEDCTKQQDYEFKEENNEVLTQETQENIQKKKTFKIKTIKKKKKKNTTTQDQEERLIHQVIYKIMNCTQLFVS